MANPALIILPTYNEAQNLEPLMQVIEGLSLPVDALVVDDNSPDGTGEIADRLAAEHPWVHVLHRPGKQGLGTAYIAGFAWALERTYTYVLQMDCDFSHHPRYLATFLQLIPEADLVIGSRYVPGGGTPDWGILRRVLSYGGNLYARSTLGLQVRDCTGGFRCYGRSLLERIPWDLVRVRGYAFQVGATYHASCLGGTIVEFPILFESRRAGHSKMSLRIVLEAFSYVTRQAYDARVHRQARQRAEHRVERAVG